MSQTVSCSLESDSWIKCSSSLANHVNWFIEKIRLQRTIHEFMNRKSVVQCAWIAAGLMDGCMDSMQNGLQRYISAYCKQFVSLFAGIIVWRMGMFKGWISDCVSGIFLVFGWFWTASFVEVLMAMAEAHNFVYTVFVYPICFVLVSV